MQFSPICTVALVLSMLLSAPGCGSGPSSGSESTYDEYDKFSAELKKREAAYYVARRAIEDSDAYKNARKAKDHREARVLLNSVKRPDILGLAKEAVKVADQLEGDSRAKLLSWAAVKCYDLDLVREIVGTLSRDHVTSPTLTVLLENAAIIRRPLGAELADKFLDDVIAKSPHKMPRAWALYWKSRAMSGRGADPADAAKAPEVLAQAAELAAGTWLGDKIGARQFNKDRLQIGQVIPNIVGEDLEGVSFALEDYRGKVVVLDFWGFWCPPCLEMIPHARSLVERLKDKPFALIGVNSDDDKGFYRTRAKEMGITWRSFWNGPRGKGGPISNKWGISGWPTIYVLDHKGVIRFNGTRGKKMDDAVDQLLAEME